MRMFRKSLGILLFPLLLVLGVGTACDSASLTRQLSPEEIASKCPIITAVPSDAALLGCFSRLSDLDRMLSDSSFVLSPLLCGTGKLAAVIGGLPRSLRNSQTAISMHYRKELTPLLLLSAGRAAGDSTAVFELAREQGIAASVLNCATLPEADAPLRKAVLFLLSPSEDLIGASKSHILNGASILDDTTFIPTASANVGDDAIYISHKYGKRIFSFLFKRPYSTYGAFMESFADWTVLRGSCPFEVGIYAREDAEKFWKVVAAAGDAECRAGEVLPGGCDFALSIPMRDTDSYIDRYLAYLDATGRLDKRKARMATLGDSLKISPREWARRLRVKEVAVASTGSGQYLFLRPGAADMEILCKDTGLKTLKGNAGGIYPFAYRSFIPAAFGTVFDIPSQKFFTPRDGWLVIGSRRDLEAYLESPGQGHPQSLNKGITAWLSFSADLDNVFARPVSKAMSDYYKCGPALSLSLRKDGGSLEISRSNPEKCTN